MNFFKKLLDKKTCDICGGEISLLGNRKLEDGNCCKACANKLSVWFDDRRRSTIAEINEQLAYREANREAVRNFQVSRSYGESDLLYIDDDAQKFLITQTGHLEEENPDVVSLEQITGANLYVKDRRDEILKQTQDGMRESYQPPRYRYYYDFYIVIRVRHPYFDEMRMRLNNFTVEIEDTGSAFSQFDPRHNPEYELYENMAQEILFALK